MSKGAVAKQGAEQSFNEYAVGWDHIYFPLAKTLAS
jgi:hypothetical protein